MTARSPERRDTTGPARRRVGQRWRSEAVPLRVLGTTGALMAVGLAGCSPASFQRNVYRSQGDCAADYSAAQCSRQDGWATGPAYLGPVYRVVGGQPSACKSSDPGGGRPLSTKQGVEQVSRGGFGGSCRSRRSSPFWGLGS